MPVTPTPVRASLISSILNGFTIASIFFMVRSGLGLSVGDRWCSGHVSPLAGAMPAFLLVSNSHNSVVYPQIPNRSLKMGETGRCSELNSMATYLKSPNSSCPVKLRQCWLMPGMPSDGITSKPSYELGKAPLEKPLGTNINNE